MHLSSEQMRELLNDDQKLHAFMTAMDTVSNFENLYVDNTEAKEKNAALKYELAQLESEIQQERQNLEQHRNTFNQKSLQQQQIASRFSVVALENSLAEKAQKLEEVLEEQAESFVAHGTFNPTNVQTTPLNGDNQFFLDNFLKNWRSDRAQLHLCQLKANFMRNPNKPATQPQQPQTQHLSSTTNFAPQPLMQPPQPQQSQKRSWFSTWKPNT